MVAAKTAEVADVPGAATLETVDETLPCGTGRATIWRDATGTVLRQDYTVFVAAGVLAAGDAQL